MSKSKCTSKIIKTECLATGVYSLVLQAPEIAKEAEPGQFASLYTKDGDTLLPRPISICEYDKVDGWLRFVYRIVGKGTVEFSKLQEGDTLEIMGPLGNGFPTEGKHALLVAGGIGIPPMLELAKQIQGKVTVVIGYRDSQTFLLHELEKVADRVIVATDDGSVGTHGTVVDAMEERKEELADVDVIYSCGPLPMLRGVKEYGIKEGISTYVSMEEKMACGIGACLACVCQSTEVDPHSNVKNKRICKDGPVFLSTEIEL